LTNLPLSDHPGVTYSRRGLSFGFAIARSVVHGECEVVKVVTR
jgi:hypothetical protein